MRSVGKVIPILWACSLLGAAGPLVDWRIDVADPQSGGKFSSLRVDANGNAHVAYVDSVNIALRYGFWDNKLQKWFNITLDKTQGFCSLTLDSKQHPHISYLEWGTGKVKYAHWDGAAWQKQTLQVQAKEISFYTSIAVDANDYPAIAFYEYFNAEGDNDLRMRTIMWNGKYWEVRTVDPTPGSGKFNSIASDPKGLLSLAYANVKYENTSLRFGRWNGQSWETEFVEGQGATGYGAFSVILVFDKENIPHIAYTDVAKNLLKYASRRGGGWQIDVVDTLVKFAYPDRNGLAFDDAGNPYLSYFDEGRGVLKVAHKKGNAWVAEVVDQQFAGYTSSIQIHDNTIWVTYPDGVDGRLMVARRTIEQPESATKPDPGIKQGSASLKP